jgi:predicted DNA-binding helix-hairpin-helix protein
MMDTTEKLELLASHMNLEPAEEYRPAPQGAGLASCRFSPPQPACGSSRETSFKSKQDALGIHRAVMPGGKRIALLKTLLTSACERDCYYCPFRAGRDFRRATFKPEEMARTFVDMHQAKVAEGLFLSSGMAGGGVTTQDRLIATAEVLRHRLGYRGYLHLKLMPGAERAQVERAMQLADRVSLNLEAPNSERLARLAPHKTFLEELVRPLQWVEEIRRTQPARLGWNGHWPSTTTQFVVGAVGESDLELLTVTARLNKTVRLARAYFSGFNPIEDTPLENHSPENPWREHRLYQASFLLRDYGFDVHELPFTSDGNLPLDADPKLAWAWAHLRESPLEVNRADRQKLLRIPGIGVKGVEAILAARRKGKLRDLCDLSALGVISTRAAPFVLLDGRRPTWQMSLW